MNDTSSPPGDAAVADFLARLRSRDDANRRPAWQEAWVLGAAAVKPLIAAMGHTDPELARAARRALWNVVDHSGGPGADALRRDVVGALLDVLGGAPVAVPTARELMWMLSTVGEAESLPAVAARLKDPELREDARCALQRFPGDRATAALREAMAGATGDFAHALADALRARGENIREPASRRLVPSRSTAVGESN